MRWINAALMRLISFLVIDTVIVMVVSAFRVVANGFNISEFDLIISTNPYNAHAP